MLNFEDHIDPAEPASKNLDIRIQPSAKARIAQAAELSGVKVTTFARAAAVREAERVLQDHQVTRLTRRDQAAFLAALDNPPEPTAHARDAVNRYRQRVTNAR